MFKQTIVRTPAECYINGLTTSSLGKPEFSKVLEQHEAYVEGLKKCGVEVHILPCHSDYPDSTFVEDTAVLTDQFAVISNPGAETRNGEISEMEPVLHSYFEKVYSIHNPGTLDGGDVLQIDNHFYIGLSARTNLEGAKQFKEIVEGENYQATIIQLEKFFHLKTGISYLGKQTIVVAGEFIDHPDFNQYKKIIVPPEEEYAANCIRVNDYILLPAGYPKTKQNIEDAGYRVVEIEMSEFQKQDGGLSCLSLRF
jgi:dimethylargininase